MDRVEKIRERIDVYGNIDNVQDWKWLISEIERLRKEILKYGQHTGDCRTHWMPCEEDCSCGWLKMHKSTKGEVDG
ncbi:unnamed protein product [marine sediment metagenome]|uniref:Uncharacterized protein n=1 Tax=marine sediment metagenome TaxID=412755 RepID=X0WMY7_9ZZZZ